MRKVIRKSVFVVAAILALSGVTAEGFSADSQPDMKLIGDGHKISLTVAGIGCAGCHGRYGEGDVGVGPYIRGESLSKIQAAIAAVSQMQIVKDQLKTEDIAAVAYYYSWLGQHQLLKTLVKRDRFIPDTVDIYPGTAVQLAINNSGQLPRKFAGPDMNVAEFQVPGMTAHEFFWRAPEREGVYTLRCVDCVVKDQQLTINVTKAAKPYALPVRVVK